MDFDPKKYKAGKTWSNKKTAAIQKWNWCNDKMCKQEKYHSGNKWSQVTKRTRKRVLPGIKQSQETVWTAGNILARKRFELQESILSRKIS